MMNVLFESNARPDRGLRGTAISIVVHSSLVFFAVYATARASGPPQPENPEQRITQFPTTPPARPARPASPERPVPPGDRAARAAETEPAPADANIVPFQAPLSIPLHIQPIDPLATMSRALETTGKRNLTDGAVSDLAPSSEKNAGVYGMDEVDEQVLPVAPSVSPVYPSALRSRGVEGEVVAQFVVNESGRVDEATFFVVNAPDPAFVRSVKAALSRMRFRPARIRGNAVSQVVRQAFVFTLDR